MSAVLGMMGQSKKGDDNGIWHRVCLNTIVRKGVKLDSERLKILPMGAKVLVMEQKERRVRISQPIAGWCSLHSSNGDTILSVLQNKSEPGDLMEAQREVAENLEHKHKERMDQIEGVINHAKLSSNVNIKDMAMELEDLKKQVQEAQETKEKQKMELSVLRSENDLDKAQIEELLQTLQNSESHAEELNNRLQSVMNQLGDAGDERLHELVNQHEVTEFEINSLQADLETKQKLAERMKLEISRLSEKLKNNFSLNDEQPGEKKQDSGYVFRPGDVLQTNRNGPAGSEIVIIKYFGSPSFEHREQLTCPNEFRDQIIHGEALIGVQRDAPWEGVTCNGDGIFQAKENCGYWITPEMVKRIITPKQLLHQLAKYVGSLVQNRTTAE